jgi:hypothetical protein
VNTPATRQDRFHTKREAGRSSRRIAYGIVAVVVVLIIAYIVTGIPAIPGGGAAHTTALESGEESSTVAGLFEALSAGIMGGQIPALNQGIPVITDTPPIP